MSGKTTWSCERIGESTKGRSRLIDHGVSNERGRTRANVVTGHLTASSGHHAPPKCHPLGGASEPRNRRAQEATMSQDAQVKKSPLLAAQAGITNRPQEHLLLAALNIVGEAKAALEQLRTIVREELTSDVGEPADAAGLASETGELGFVDGYDRAHLTITLGLASTAYDKLRVPAADRPQDLVPIPWSQLGDNPLDPQSGDLVLQICSDSAYVSEHALRHIEASLSGAVQLVWAHTGVQRHTSRAGRTAREEGRAWNGFIDGLSNLNPRREAGDAALVFVDPAPATVAGYPKTPASGQAGPYGQGNVPIFPPDLREHPGQEPESTRNGSYMAVRISQLNLHDWDSQPLQAQEQAVGRSKDKGIALDVLGQTDASATTEPVFASNPDVTDVALNAHIRKANPRTADDQDRRIFRRGYPLYEGSNQGLQRGLIFISFGRTLSTQFEFITRAWLINPNFPHQGAGVDRLREFDSAVLTGGYYFVPPVENERQPWSWHLPAAP